MDKITSLENGQIKIETTKEETVLYGDLVQAKKDLELKRLNVLGQLNAELNAIDSDIAKIENILQQVDLQK